MHGPENTINQGCPEPHFAPSSGVQTPLIRIPVLACALLWAGLAIPAGDRLSGFSEGDTVSIQAENAWEDVTPDTIHFSGHFELRAHDWYLSADQATLYGNLDNPETAILTGSPANIQLEIDSNGQPETITGEAARIVYQRATNSIRMEGRASLSTAGQMMKSDEIEYDIDRDRIQTGGTQGVRIQVEPED